MVDATPGRALDTRALRPPSPTSVPVSRPEGHRAFVGLAVAAGLGLLLGLALVVPRGEGGASAAPLRLYGEELPAGADGTETGVERAERRLKAWFNLELPDGRHHRILGAELGVELDRARLRRVIRDTANARGTTSAFSQVSPETLELVVPVRIDPVRALATLLALKQELDQPALDARLAVDSRAVTPERVGRWLDVDRSLAAIEDALEHGASAATLCFQSEPPRRRAGDLAGVRHDVRLGSFESPIDASPRAHDRAFNLGVAASKLDGQVLMPGAVFDFNAAVGPRDEAEGYRVASLAATGEPLDGSGSSTSQISGTLHAAALFAGLDVVERHLPERPGVVDIGLDAAVAYPGTNLRLKNPYGFPVVLRAIVAAGRLRAEVRGPERPHAVSVVRKLDRAIPFAEIESADATLERGVRVVAQRGVPGVDLHRYRIRRDGAHAVREVSRDRYPPSPQLVRVGVGSSTAATIAKHSTTHRASDLAASTAGRPPYDASTTSEYLADELLVASQTDDIDAPLVQQRLPGRFAVPGWSKDIGSPTSGLARQPAENPLLRPRAGDFLEQ
jgi:vancomycin resistance protein YoaR